MSYTPPRELSKTLEQTITCIEENFDHAEKDFLLDEIFHVAAAYWEDVDEGDFCLGHSSNSTFRFGNKNVIVWSPGRGFELIQGSEAFRAKYEKLGPLPDKKATTL